MCKCIAGHEVHPQPEQESIFRIFLLGRILRATTKKGCQLFHENSAPPRQNPGYAYANVKMRKWNSLHSIVAGRLFKTTVRWCLQYIQKKWDVDRAKWSRKCTHNSNSKHLATSVPIEIPNYWLAITSIAPMWQFRL